MHKIASRQAQIARRRIAVDAYKVERGCEECGWNEDACALDLDHKDRNDKLGKISYLVTFASWPVILAELEKCRVLCATHHRIKTHRERDYTHRKPPSDGERLSS